MQKNEVIIEQFVKTIKESSIDVKGDPVLLSKVFEALEKKKKRRKFIPIFWFLAFGVISLSFVIWGFYNQHTTLKEGKNTIGLAKHQALDMQNDVTPLNDIKEKSVILPEKKSSKTKSKKQDDRFTNVISYKFKNHQVDIFKNGTEEFMQINVFGVDGSETDVLEIIEDLKKSYKNNELYVDSVKNK